MDQQDERDSHAVAESDGSSNADAQAPKRDQQDERDSHAVAESDGSSSADAQAPKRDLKGERDALRMISYGLYILTTAKEEKVHAITCNWVTQISFDPTLLLVAIEKDSYCYELLQESGVFALSFLAKIKAIGRGVWLPPTKSTHTNW